MRELENTIARALVVARGDRIEPDDILQNGHESHGADRRFQLEERGAEAYSACALMCGGNKSKAAEMLGISRRYLHYKLKEWEEHP